MITNDNAKTYNISANISPIDIELCKVYIRGAVNAICNYSEIAEFSVRILFGGNNNKLDRTPLFNCTFKYNLFNLTIVKRF